jgi:pimeloyl-ACP methyl ester carboxylesterase/DNA-binding winged helix-turn-helix (wHTH) protein
MIFAFADFEIDEGCREVRKLGRPVHVEPQVFDILVYLIRHRGRVVARADLLDEIWGGRVVSEATLGSRINAARRTIGDSGLEQNAIRTVPRHGFRFVADVFERPSRVAVSHPSSTDFGSVALGAERQLVSFCTTPDEVKLAIASIGSGRPLVKAPNWLTHVEFDLKSPLWSPLYRHLAEGYRFIWYDARGTGLSDWQVPEISFNTFVQDLEVVIDHLGLDRVSLLGISQGAAVAIAYAARYPERVDSMVLLGSYALGRHQRQSPTEEEKGNLFLSLMRQGWGIPNSAFLKAFSSIYIPDGTDEQVRWFTELQNATATPENAMRIRQACDRIDVSAELAQVRARTLVMHCRNDNIVPLDHGRSIAAAISGARFVVLDTANHIALPGEPAWTEFMVQLDAFLR